MTATKFTSDGTVYAVTKSGKQNLLPPGDYVFGSDGTLSRYSDRSGLSGFWSSIGSGISSVGKWVGNHFGTIAIAGATIGTLALGGSLLQGQGGALTPQQQQAAAQAQANAIAQQQARAQPLGGDLTSMLPYLLIGGAVLLVMSKRSN